MSLERKNKEKSAQMFLDLLQEVRAITFLMGTAEAMLQNLDEEVFRIKTERSKEAGHLMEEHRRLTTERNMFLDTMADLDREIAEEYMMLRRLRNPSIPPESSSEESPDRRT